METTYSILIAVGAPKGSGPFEVWQDTKDVSRGVYTSMHCGYFKTRDEARAWINQYQPKGD